MRGVPATTFQSHLDYFCWCAAQEGEFLRDVRVVDAKFNPMIFCH